MNLFQTVILVTITGNTALGLFILLANPKRTVNISFFVLTLLVIAWLGSMLITTLPHHSAESLLFWVRQTSALAGFIPFSLFILNAAIVDPDISIGRLLHKLRYWIIICLCMMAVCHSPYFILSTQAASEAQTVPVSEYGIGFVFYLVFFSTVSIAMIMAARKSSKTLSGIQRAESHFLQLGCWLGFSGGISLYAGSIIFDFQEISRFVPLSVLILDGFVAYGIATRRILSAPEVIQRVLAYVLIVLYLALLYIASAWVGTHLFMYLVDDPTYLSHLLAALIVAFSLAPAHGWMQAFSRGLLPHSHWIDVDEILTEAESIFQTVSSETRLIEQFSLLIIRTFGPESLTLLRPEQPDKSFVLVHPESGKQATTPRIHASSPLIRHIEQTHAPLTGEMLDRMRPSTEITRLREQFRSLPAAAAVGCFVRNRTEAILLLSHKKNQRIYDLHEQRALQILCDRFAVALDNSALYTAVQNGKIYNEILLDSLTSGVIAVDSNRTVTVFNQQAQTLTGLAESAALQKSLSILPSPLADALETVLKTNSGFRDRDLVLEQDDRPVSLRVSGSLFRSHTGHLLGALLVFNDMSELRKMEEQLRRTDRLSSIGTLSAGMAHEIKNPLVTIKTFTQLLPEQYRDEEFRQAFSLLVDQEVQRIDDIVGRLLTFSRPAKAALRPASLHQMIGDALRLVTARLVQGNIDVDLQLDADRDIVDADAGQINQALINFFLNAMDAMNHGGLLTVRTRIDNRTSPDPSSSSNTPCPFLLLEIEDTGCGIEPDNLGRIFDPFYTTKDHGVGLGLSVSHGILQEHHALVEVESEPQKGTVLRILFPITKANG